MQLPAFFVQHYYGAVVKSCSGTLLVPVNKYMLKKRLKIAKG
jgi:hypothetical protein